MGEGPGFNSPLRKAYENVTIDKSKMQAEARGSAVLNVESGFPTTRGMDVWAVTTVSDMCVSNINNSDYFTPWIQET